MNETQRRARRRGFGSAMVDHISPPLVDPPTAINICLSFQEALKIHLGLGQILQHLNSGNRSTRNGRQAGVDLCLFTTEKRPRLTITERSTKKG
jgi:hypothetical protein